MSAIPRVTILIEISMKYTREMLRGVARYSKLHGPWNISKARLYYPTPSGRRKFVRLKLTDCHGVILLDTEHHDHVLPAGLPSIGVEISEDVTGRANIVADSERIGEMAARHFLERGFRKFAFAGYDSSPWSELRGESFRGYIEKATCTVCSYRSPIPKGPFVWRKEKPHMIKWLKTLPHPIACFTCNDERAEHVLEACRDCDIKIPDEIALLGVDNDHAACEIAQPQLSSIDMDFEKAGYDAAAILDKWMNGQNMAGETVLIQPTHVEVRQSTDILAMEDREVAHAVRFINEHVRGPIQIRDVVNNSTLSRRMLETRFKAATGVSVGAQMRRARADHMARLLRETDMSISQIAVSLGFASPANFTRYFQREFGIKPSHYRRR